MQTSSMEKTENASHPSRSISSLTVLVLSGLGIALAAILTNYQGVIALDVQMGQNGASLKIDGSVK